MLSPKINSKILLPVFLIFSNFWIYKIYNLNIIVGIVLSIVTLLILTNPGKKIAIFVMLILAVLQFQTTSIKSLVLLDNDEQRVQYERI